MSFTQAVSDGFSKYVQFNGRASRSAYWWWTLFALIVYIVALAISAAAKAPVIYYLFALALFLPSLAVGIRRLHDTDRSGWWYLIGIVPLIGSIALLVFFCTQGTAGPNRFGNGPDDGTTAGSGLGAGTPADGGPTFQKG